MTLSVNWEACVRSRSRAASCVRCVAACPTKAVSVDGPRGSVKIELSACTSCGECVAQCPTEAIGSSTAPVASAASLACTPAACLGALSTERFVTMAIEHGRLKVDGAGCERCRATREHWLERIDRATQFLTAAGLDASIVVTVTPGAPTAFVPEKPPSASRRALLGRLLPRLSEESPAPLVLVSLDATKLKERPLPADRRRLLEVLPATTAKPPSWLGEAEVDFTSDKRIDPVTCTGCQQCVSVCPTGALTASRDLDAIAFDASRCVKCRSCHDACEPNAITVTPRFELSRFLERRSRELVRYTVKACAECGVRFKYDGGDALCPRCASLDDEAHELHGLPVASRGSQA